MKITLTGYSGFVGTNLTDNLLSKKYNISKLSLRDKDWTSKLDKNSNVIIHLAGKAHDTKNVSDTSEYFKVNTDLTIHLFEEFLKSDIKDFFCFSSVKAVADTVEGVLTETVKANPLTPYGKSKLEAEKYLLSQHLPKEKRLFIIRPCMIHGPGNKGNLNLLYKLVKIGIPYPLSAFNNQRSFLSIDNLCFLVEAMIKQSSIPGGIYNFADDEVLSTNQLVTLIAAALEKKSRLWMVNPSLIKSLAYLGDKLNLPLNSERLKKLTENYVVSNQKIKNALKIKKLPLTAEQGLVKTIKSFSKI